MRQIESIAIVDSGRTQQRWTAGHPMKMMNFLKFRSETGLKIQTILEYPPARLHHDTYNIDIIINHWLCRCCLRLGQITPATNRCLTCWNTSIEWQGSRHLNCTKHKYQRTKQHQLYVLFCCQDVSNLTYACSMRSWNVNFIRHVSNTLSPIKPT